MFETSATVIKDAGDDPDITNGMKVVANIAIPFRIDDPLPEDTPQDDYNIIVCGGEGVGVVTMPGLGLELGSSAINDTPREMIKKNVKLWLERLHIAKQPNPILITISIPGGEEIAKRTFNPRLGIEGGISIIGTSGIVKPFSSEAFINSIRKSMEVAKATRNPRIVISSGAKSERFIKAYYPDLPAQAFVHYGNFIGETLKIAAEEQVPHVTLGVMMGKAVKLAEGNLDTHSKKVTMNKEFIQDLARQTGCSEETLAAIGQMNLARELWDIIPEELLEKFGKALIELCHRHCDPLLPNGELTVLLITENGKFTHEEEDNHYRLYGNDRTDRSGTKPAVLSCKAGIGTSHFHGKHSSSDTQIAYKAGVGAEYVLNKTWVLQSALEFVSIGGKDEISHIGKAKMHELYLQIPLMIAARLHLGKDYHASLSVGPYAAIGVAGKTSGETYDYSSSSMQGGYQFKIDTFGSMVDGKWVTTVSMQVLPWDLLLNTEDSSSVQRHKWDW